MLADKRKLFSFICLGVGVLFVIVGIIVVAVIPVVVKSKVKNTVPLTPDGETGKNWLNPPYDITMSFYIFNVSNPDEVVMTGAKPSLIQYGPYIYRESQAKLNVSWAADGTWVDYWNRKAYTWAPDLTHAQCPTCQENDTFVVPNVPLISIMQLVSGMDKGIQEAAGYLMVALGQRPFTIPQTARDLIYHGYENPLLTFANSTVGKIAMTILNISLSFPDRMGFFYKKNGTTDGEYRINAGENDVGDVGRIKFWWKSDHLPDSWWSDQWARKLNGTDGTLYPPFLKRSDKPQMFISDICRSIYVEYYQDITHSGIQGYRYVVPAAVFNATLPQNDGFCTNTITSKVQYYSKTAQSKDGCLPSGLLDISQCQQGNPPVVVSSPHFLFCPDEVVRSIGGMFPDKEGLQTTIDLEPTTGIGLQFQRKLQLNVAMARYKNILQFENIRNLIVPVMWLNESATVNQDTVKLLKKQVTHSLYNVINLQVIIYALAYTAIGVGLLCAVGVGVAFLVFRKQQSEIQESLTNPVYSGTSTMTSSTAATPQIMRHEPGIRYDTRNDGLKVDDIDSVPNGKDSRSGSSD